MDTQERWHRGHTGKRRYHLYAQARAVAVAARRRRTVLGVYRCRYCQDYHLSSDLRDQIDRDGDYMKRTCR